MYPIDLRGKVGVVFGVANENSIAWPIAKVLHQAGSQVVMTYQNDRLKSRATKLSEQLQGSQIVRCDVSDDDQIEAVYDEVRNKFGQIAFVIHSIAYANREDMGGSFSKIGRDGFNTALEISAYSLIPITRYAVPIMGVEGGSIVTLTFQASGRVFPGYNIMGTAKAALENEVRQLAAEYGCKGVRVNAISAGPLDTLAGRGIPGFLDMKRMFSEKAPLMRNITHDEVAKTALFLCSDLSTGITGSVIPVDAGYHIMAV